MRRSRSPASSCCTASGRDSSDWDVWAFKAPLHLQSGTRCFGPEVCTAKPRVLARAGYLHQSLGRQLQQSDIAGHHESVASVPAGTIEDHYGMGIVGDLAADLAEVMVHGDGIADRHDQRRRLALRRADRAKHIGRGEAEILWRDRPAAGLPPHPGQGVLLADASLVLKPYLDSRIACLRRPDSL